MVFTYPSEAHRRRHGPQGYVDYTSYKPWLRDEFQFRCVYCLCREVWLPDGEASFGTDHFRPWSLAPELLTDYDNLFYVCLGCNSTKRDAVLPSELRVEAMSAHLRVGEDGTVQGLTPQGWELIDVCGLNRPRLIEYRRRMRQLLDALRSRKSTEAQALLREYLGYPADLLNLITMRPPGGNTRPEGISTSYYELRERGELPEVY